MKIVCCEKKGGDSPSLLRPVPKLSSFFRKYFNSVLPHVMYNLCLRGGGGGAKKKPRGLIYNLRFPVTSKNQNIFSTRSPSGSEHTYK